MPVDEALLKARSSYRDERLGITEQFVRLPTGAGETWGVAAIPLGERRSPACIVCHSFGLEQVDLHMTDVAFARALAASGHPSLRFHCQGYGDSDDLTTPPTPATHLRDTLAVAEVAPRLTGLSELAFVGSRFGGTVAALAAARLDAPQVVMAAPVVSGSKYVLELLRSRVYSELMGDVPETAVTVQDMKTELAERGVVNVKGWPLRSEQVEELERIDLLTQLDGFTGRALVLQVSRGETRQKGLVRLADHLRRAGVGITLSVVNHPAAPNFGFEHFHPVAKDLLGDTTAGVNQALCERALAWFHEDAA
jgi:pimeloyl-ACP methyl ester carboxylesterase